MSPSSAVEWWDESQLRVLVLSSLGIQYLLAIFAGGRRFSVPRWYRFLIWLCYLGSDALAIYSLATLFNRQRKEQYKFSKGSRDLEVLWAPILLMHLGGQFFITAYNIEDNELWRRHIVTGISQITVALYVFCKSWSPSADRRLLTTAILVFILGIIKCTEKSFSLKDASFNSLARDSQSAQRTSTKNREEELKKYVKEARVFILADDPPPTLSNIEDVKVKQLNVPDKLFVDSVYPYHDRITSLKSFFMLDNQTACLLLRNGLTNIFNVLYTKYEPSGPDVYKNSLGCYGFIWMGTIVVSIVAISLFHSSNKKPYSSSDVRVSLVLLYGTFLLDIFSVLVYGILLAAAEDNHDVVAQHSLVGFFAGKKMNSCQSLEDITEIIRQYIRDGWKEYITDAESYKKFNDMRGQWKLEREGCDERLGWSLEKPFDESVLVWHIATDLCFHTGKYSDDKCSSRSTEISNYMMHLLFDNPEMLMTGSRRNLFKTACKQLEHILKGEDTSLDKKELTQKIISEVSKEGSEESFIRDAWLLSEGLMNSPNNPGDERKMWEVIQGVWVEMICFSASRCRGYLHAKSLGSGVEYLSYVWLLLAHSGMETLPERLQRPHKLRLSKEKAEHCQNRGEDATTPSAPHGEESLKEQEIIIVPSTAEATEFCIGEETTVTSSTSQGEGTVPDLKIVIASQ